jgi:ubiquinol-cytochrome c reductase iron-sulfur subunit
MSDHSDQVVAHSPDGHGSSPDGHGSSPDGHGWVERADPGLPPHQPRRSDVDPRAARRVERQVSVLFLIGMLTPIAFWLEYVYIPRAKIVTIPGIGPTSASNFFLGMTMGVGLFCVGAGAIHWAKKLMPDREEVSHRYQITGTEEERAAAVNDFMIGAEDSGFLKYKMIRRTLIGALAATPLFAIPFLKDLGPMPGTDLRHTLWARGVRIVADVSLQPLRPEDIPFGGLVSGVPATLAAAENADGNLDERAKAPVVLVRIRPDEIVAQQGRNWDYEGILCYSKICTHLGCPTALYQQKSHLLLCPCHQSTFDLADAGKVVFGPAARSMPQLPIMLDSDGYLVASSDFTEPIGPSFWERG